MKIAVAVNENMVSQHFGHCENFKMFEVENNEIVSNNTVPNPGHKPGFLPVFLKENNVDIIIAGGMGGAAQDLFNQNGIKVVVGVSGDADTVVEGYIKGTVKSTGAVCQH